AEQALHLGEPCGLERTGVLTGRINQIERNDLALDEVVVEVNDFAVLCRQLHIREVARTPAGVLRSSRSRDEKTQDGEDRNGERSHVAPYGDEGLRGYRPHCR